MLNLLSKFGGVLGTLSKPAQSIIDVSKVLSSQRHLNLKSSKSGEEDIEDEDEDNSAFSAKHAVILHSFANAHKKEKETFLECLRLYEKRAKRKRELTAFIYTALKYMEEFNVHEDLEVYRQIIDLFPKQKMVPTNQFQTMYMHYPREQYCATAILEQMEDNQVFPDGQMELQLLSIFGKHGLPLQKYGNMMYWMPKFKHLNPWPVPKPTPNDVMELAKLAMQKISSIDVRSEVTVFDTKTVKDSIDKTWIVSAMAPDQADLLLRHNKTTPIFVEGPFRIYVGRKCLDYFTLKAKPIKDRLFPDDDLDDVSNLRIPYLETETLDLILPPNCHEQEDGTIFANCATGTSSKDSLLSWVRCLQKRHPVLSEIPIVFMLRNYAESQALEPVKESKDQQVSNL